MFKQLKISQSIIIVIEKGSRKYNSLIDNSSVYH